MNTRIKAFTIMEVTVAMLISAIVIGMAYTCFHIISKSYLAFKTRQSQLSEVSQFERVLSRDLDRASSIFYNPEGILMENVTYQLYPDQAIRHMSAATDTFKVQTSNLRYRFEGGTVSDKTPIDEISFDILLEGQTFPYHYFKQYSSADLFDLDTYAGH